jgi:hypothetical protein
VPTADCLSDRKRDRKREGNKEIIIEGGIYEKRIGI